MRKLTRIMLAVLVALVGSISASAHDFEAVNEGSTIYYKITSEEDLTCAVFFQGDYASSVTDEYSGSVVIPSSVEFNGKTYSVTSIGESAFYGCSSLTLVEIPNSVTKIDDYAFRGCSSLTSVVIPNSVTKIGSSAFENCTSLTSIEIPNSVTEFGVYAFRGCSSLTSVVIPSSVTGINDYAFQYCENLSSVVIGNSVTSIGSSAFEGCKSLKSIEIPNSVTSIGTSAFSGCTSLPVENNLRYADTYLVEAVDKNLSSYTIKEGTKWIGYSAFKYCENLKSIEIPNSVIEIGYSAFNYCKSLTSVKIPNSVTEIDSYAFYYCKSLTSIEIPNSVTKINMYAFSSCTNLKEITSLNTTPPSLDSRTFNNVDKETCVLKVPAESVDSYKAADYWKEFLNIEGLSEEAGINSIANGAASGKTYGINGAIVGDGYKGIVIRNGKKILVK